MSLNETVQQKRDEMLEIAAKYGAYNLRLFGSVVRGEADEESDIEILVDMEPGRRLLDLGGLLLELHLPVLCKSMKMIGNGYRDRSRYS